MFICFFGGNFVFILKKFIFCLHRHPKQESLQNAKQLAINLIQTMQSELQSYIQQQPPPVQSQQVIEQSQIQQSMN